MSFTPPHREHPLTSSSTTKPPRDYWFYNDRVKELNSRFNSTRRQYRRNPAAQTGRSFRQLSVLPTGGKLTFEGSMAKLVSRARLPLVTREMWGQLSHRRQQRPIRPPHPDPAREAERLASSFATRTCTDNLPAETPGQIDRAPASKK
ncbi:hypothetical protein GWK47_032293 [Chionoecetes opilio]|uniref:Uncharacterized protein n=1 Tax=Chionoecetes opilio TaxID=41210 RepID=A0A8J4YKH1_CHIOP|nr:hypothetical protein GWK47_032293 [Chionoecetes opilio]